MKYDKESLGWVRLDERIHDFLVRRLIHKSHKFFSAKGNVVISFQLVGYIDEVSIAYEFSKKIVAVNKLFLDVKNILIENFSFICSHLFTQTADCNWAASLTGY